MTLSRKHYIKIAQILAENNVNEKLINDFCYFLKYDNGNFNESRFKAYIEKNQPVNL